jgi:hypothetical protein
VVITTKWKDHYYICMHNWRRLTSFCWPKLLVLQPQQNASVSHELPANEQLDRLWVTTPSISRAACTSSSNSAWLFSGADLAGAFDLAGFTGDTVTRPPLPTLAGGGGGTALEDDAVRLVDVTCMMLWPLSLSKLEPEAAGEIVT